MLQNLQALRHFYLLQTYASADKPKGESNCKFYDNRTALHHGSLPPAFDLEELVDAGKENGACPYFAARAMAVSAHIVFCPYNYLIEPGIRSSVSQQDVSLSQTHSFFLSLSLSILLSVCVCVIICLL